MGGPIPFSDFMTSALFDPNLGYYRRGRATVGRDGDFLTSPEVHPLFGYAVGTVAAGIWERLGRPHRFVLREVGPGNGALLEAALRWTHSSACAAGDPFAAALQAELVEPDRTAQAQQRQRLAGFSDVAWYTTIEEAPPIEGLVVANELLDAQPVHRLRWAGAQWEELCVAVNDAGAFVDAANPISNTALLAPLTDVQAREGQIVEVCLALEPLVTDLAASVQRGALLLFDYGYPRTQLYAPWRREGTMMTFYRHTPGDDPYARVGEQDITCHVDLNAVRDAATRAGMTAYAPRSQAQFLEEIGATLTPSVADSDQRGAAMEEYLTRRRAVETLTDPGGLGQIQVLGFARGMEDPLPGLGPPGNGDGA